jgi:hypothetical protein
MPQHLCSRGRTSSTPTTPFAIPFRERRPPSFQREGALGRRGVPRGRHNNLTPCRRQVKRKNQARPTCSCRRDPLPNNVQLFLFNNRWFLERRIATAESLELERLDRRRSNERFWNEFYRGTISAALHPVRATAVWGLVSECGWSTSTRRRRSFGEMGLARL